MAEKFYSIAGEPQVAASARNNILKEFEDLEFIEEGHKYFLNGKSLHSASEICKRFIKSPFNARLQAARYAEKNGKSPEYWIRKWDCNSFRASTLGTKTHAFGESLSYVRVGHPEYINPLVSTQYNSELNYLAPIHPKEESVTKFFSELSSSYHLVLNETKVYSGKNPDSAKNLKEQICGTFDMLCYYDGNDSDNHQDGFVIFDYKTNGDLYNNYNRKYGKMLVEPFSDMVEEDLNLYAIQLSLYSLMLEDIGINVIGRKIVWLKDDGTYQIVDLPDLSSILRKIL